MLGDKQCTLLHPLCTGELALDPWHRRQLKDGMAKLGRHGRCGVLDEAVRAFRPSPIVDVQPDSAVIAPQEPTTQVGCWNGCTYRAYCLGRLSASQRHEPAATRDKQCDVPLRILDEPLEIHTVKFAGHFHCHQINERTFPVARRLQRVVVLDGKGTRPDAVMAIVCIGVHLAMNVRPGFLIASSLDDRPDPIHVLERTVFRLLRTCHCFAFGHEAHVTKKYLEDRVRPHFKASPSRHYGAA